MNGVLLLCLRSGTCLYSKKKYTEGFGLPSGALRQGGAADAMSLAGILYALYLQTNAAHSADQPSSSQVYEGTQEGQRPDGLQIDINSLCVGDTVLYFSTDRALDLMVVASIESTITQTVGRHSSQRLMAAVVEQHREYLSKVVRNPSGLKRMSALLRTVYQELPEFCALSAMKALANWQPGWLYVAHSPTFFAAISLSTASSEVAQLAARRWWPLTRSSSAVTSPVLVGSFQFLYRPEGEQQRGGPRVGSSSSAVDALALVVQRAAEALSLLSPTDGREYVRSMEILLEPQADGTGDWYEGMAQRMEAFGKEGAQSSQGLPSTRDLPRHTRVLVAVRGNTVVAIPMQVKEAVSGVMSTVQRVMQEDVSQLAIFMGFLQRHIPEAKIQGSAVGPSAP
eukprot:CAMPEP_0117657524 /NCGR_PEP_ID=MMETSP0804-20121206/5378_1 /TAXON_ID=1074897 /ORGANISM="Tetraselmis astigmatica, Strain CCMP880" /LENGTH=396 /DNA_ID=CAMNT_0005463987 /DNA_START=411 /DNA_END=1601 /DNA_ORIENTATION=+